ncbi:MAG: hypothetical protein ACFFCS_18900, partial [Candidatus Hodarchaeota archaeon]
YGCVPRKSKIIQFPELTNKKLDLAFLLGFYDGDGKKNTTQICTGSSQFLKQIKEKFNLGFEIRKDEYDGTIEGRKIHSKGFKMHLGADLFNKMMNNYKWSLPSKRRFFSTNEEKAKLAAEASKSNTGKPIFNISGDELEKLVWEKPTTEIAREFGVSDKAISKRCAREGIEKPGRGFWVKKRSNK